MDFSSIDVEAYDKYTFGKCIRKQREELGMSLRSVAANIGISAAYLSDIEKGNRYAPISKNNLDIIYKLLEILNISNEQSEYVIDMAYSTHGCHKDILEYLSECEKARKFIRYVHKLELSDSEWNYLFEQLGEIKNNKVLKK